MGCNFDCDWRFLMNFGYVIHIVGRKFFTKKLKVMFGIFYNVYIDLTLITPLVKVESAPKFVETFFNYLSKDPKSFINLSQKAPKIFEFSQTT